MPTAPQPAPNTRIEYEALVFPTAREAIQHAKSSDCGSAIRLDGRNLVVREEDAHRLAAAGIEFAYLCDHKGRVVTVPVN